MSRSVAIDRELLEVAMNLGGTKSESAVVNEALREYVRRRQRRQAVEHFGTFDFDPDYDHKIARQR